MGVANSRAVVFPGQGIDVLNGLTVGMKDPYYGYLANANNPNGALVADASGIVTARFIPMLGTPAEINSFVGVAGELASDGISLRMFDGLLAGGFPINLASSACRYVSANGNDESGNGAALDAALTKLQTLTPNGAALSASNPATLFLGPGIYNLTGNAGHALINAPGGVRIIGLGGSQAVTIKCNTAHRLSIDDLCLEHALVGLTFFSVNATPGASLTWNAFDASVRNFYHEDLNFPGLTSAQSCMAWSLVGAGTTNYQYAGYARRCRTTGTALYGGFAQGNSVTFAVKFELCEGGDRSFGSSASAFGARDGIVSAAGYLYRCKHFGTVWVAKLDTQMVGCDWTPAIERLGTSAEIRDTIMRTAVGGFVVNHNATVTIGVISNLESTVGGIGTNVTYLGNTYFKTVTAPTHVGNLTGDVTGNVTGNLTGTASGNAAVAHTHPASDIVSGALALARGGTNANLSATGGTGQILKQSTVGANVSVAALLEAEIPPIVSIAGARLTGVRFVNARISPTTTGDQNVYTCPAGKRFLPLSYSFKRKLSTSTVYSIKVIIGGVTYRLSVDATAAADITVISVIGTGPGAPCYILEAGEVFVFALSAAGDGSTSWSNFNMRGIEFDNTCGLKSVKKASSAWTVGDNVIYTVPSGKSFLPIDTACGGLAGNAQISIMNESGADADVAHYAVAGGTASAGQYQITPGAVTSVVNATRSNFNLQFALGPNDSLVSTTTQTGKQFEWCNGIEITNT